MVCGFWIIPSLRSRETVVAEGPQVELQLPKPNLLTSRLRVFHYMRLVGANCNASRFIQVFLCRVSGFRAHGCDSWNLTGCAGVTSSGGAVAVKISSSGGLVLHSACGGLRIHFWVTVMIRVVRALPIHKVLWTSDVAVSDLRSLLEAQATI